MKIFLCIILGLIAIGSLAMTLDFIQCAACKTRNKSLKISLVTLIASGVTFVLLI